MADRARLAFVALSLALVSGCTGGAAVAGGPTTGPAASPTELRFGAQYHLPPEYGEWERPYQEQLERSAVEKHEHGMSAPPTDVRFVRFLKPDEYGEVYADCLNGQGFTATPTFDGGIEFGEYPRDQTPALLEAQFRCEVEYPVHPRYAQRRTTEQIRVEYDYYVKELVPCLSREGYPVNSGEIPTWETFLATYDSRKGPWVPYEVVLRKERELAMSNNGVVPPEWRGEWERINKACPQAVALDRLWPEGA